MNVLEFSPVEADLPIVAQLVLATHRRPETPVTDVAKVRDENPRRLGGPLIRRPVPETSTRHIRAGDVSGEWIGVPGGTDRPTILYFHGGAYIRGSLIQGRGIASALAALAHGRTFAVEYGLAPERPFPAPIEDAVGAYRYLLSSGVEPTGIVLAGDSCGGAIVVSAMVAMKAAKLPLPAAAVSISPWADLTMSGESYKINARKDIAEPAFTASAARIYLAGTDPRDPLASPVFADLAGLPPLLVMVGSEELLYSDAASLAAAAHQAGVQVALHVYKGMPHVFPMLNLATGDLGLVDAANFMAQHVPNRPLPSR